jgi:hypothetical protein
MASKSRTFKPFFLFLTVYDIKVNDLQARFVSSLTQGNLSLTNLKGPKILFLMVGILLLMDLFTIELTTEGLVIKFFIVGILLLKGSLYWGFSVSTMLVLWQAFTFFGGNVWSYGSLLSEKNRTLSSGFRSKWCFFMFSSVLVLKFCDTYKQM